MKTRYTLVLAAALALGVAAPIMASSYKHHSSSEHMVSPKLSQLEHALNLKDNQREAWNTYKAQMEATAQSHKNQMKTMRETMKDNKGSRHESPMAYIEMKEQMLKAEQTRMATMKVATQELHKHLSPEQQATFNQQAHLIGKHGERQNKRSDKYGEKHGGKDGGNCKS